MNLLAFFFLLNAADFEAAAPREVQIAAIHSAELSTNYGRICDWNGAGWHTNRLKFVHEVYAVNDLSFIWMRAAHTNRVKTHLFSVTNNVPPNKRWLEP